jgi:hypothetical protein
MAFVRDTRKRALQHILGNFCLLFILKETYFPFLKIKKISKSEQYFLSYSHFCNGTLITEVTYLNRNICKKQARLVLIEYELLQNNCLHWGSITTGCHSCYIGDHYRIKLLSIYGCHGNADLRNAIFGIKIN